MNDLVAATAKKKDCEKRPFRFIMLKKHKDAFNIAKEMIKTEVKLSSPDFTKPFHLYTEAGGIQLGSALVQEGGLFTRKLINEQLNYAVAEKEFFGIAKGLKAFTGVICSQDLTVHTNYLNILYNKLPSQ